MSYNPRSHSSSNSNTNRHNRHQEHDVDADARLAADMQLALDMHDAEKEAYEQAERQRRLQEEEAERQRQEQARLQQQLNEQQQLLDRFEQERRQQQQKQLPAINRDPFTNYPAAAAAAASTSRGSSHPPIVPGTPLRRPPTSTSSTSSHPHHPQSAITSDGLLQSHSNKELIYVPAEINDRLVELMVDTGAQQSVISSSLMKKLGLAHKLNRQLQGIAQGVGKARICGILEDCPASIGHVEFVLYFLVLDVPQEMIILGIDQLRRFKCIVDLEHDRLVFGGHGGVEVSFLPPQNAWVEARNKALSDTCSIS